MSTPNKNHYAELGSPNVAERPDTSVMGAISGMSRMETKLDNWHNAVTGAGSIAHSKMLNTSYNAYEVIGREQAEEMYRHDWAARKSIDAPLHDMFREGIDWAEEEGQEPTTEAIEEEFKRLDIFEQFKKTETENWKQGGALAVISFDDPFDPIEPLNPNLVRGIKRIDIVPGGRNGLAQEHTWDIDFDSPTRGDVLTYLVTFNYRNMAFTEQIHASRVIRFDSPFTTSQIQRMRNAGWNDSRFQNTYDSLRSYGVAIQSGEETLENFTFMILESAGLAASMKKGNYGVLARTTAMVNKIKSGQVAVIGEGEKLEKIGTPLTGFHELLDRYGKYMAAATWIPLSRFFSGESGALGGDTMDGDLKNYYDWIAALRESQLRGPLEQMIEFMSYYLNFDPAKIDFQFPPLVQLSALQQAETLGKVAEAYTKLIDRQVLQPEEVAISMFSSKEIDTTSMHLDKNTIAARAEMREEEDMAAEEADKIMQGDQGGNNKPKEEE